MTQPESLAPRGGSNIRTLSATVVFVATLAIGLPASGAEPLPSFLSDGVVHYDMMKIPGEPAPCVIFAREKGKVDSFGPCDGKTLTDYLGADAESHGGMAVVYPGGRVWRLSRRKAMEPLVDVPAKIFRDSGLTPAGPLAPKKVPDATFPTVHVAPLEMVTREPHDRHLAACDAFEVADFYYGVVVTGPDARTIDGDLAIARASISVEKNPRVARYTDTVIYAVSFGLGFAALVAVVSFFVMRSARAAKQKELAASEAMARAWKDRGL